MGHFLRSSHFSQILSLAMKRTCIFVALLVLVVVAETNPQGWAAGSGILVSNCGNSRCETDWDCQKNHGSGCKCKRTVGRKMGRCRPVVQGADPQIKGWNVR